MHAVVVRHPACPIHWVHSHGSRPVQAGEAVQIGLLIPAVAKVRQAGRIVVTDGDGNVMFNVPTPPTDLTPLFRIAYHATATPEGGNVFVMTDVKSGRQLGIVPNDSGVMMALLIPAVQKVREAVPPSGATAQLFDISGDTVSVSVFFSTGG